MTIEPKRGTYFTMTCLFGDGETAAKIMDAAGNNFVAGEWHNNRYTTYLMDQIARTERENHNLEITLHRLLDIAVKAGFNMEGKMLLSDFFYTRLNP
jgi:hypothetical protein